MSEMTITEALAELKTIDKRVEKKQEFVLGYLWRQRGMVDPHEKAGGSVAFVAQEQQGIRDLLERKVAIRDAINQANAREVILVGGVTRSIAQWLTWRREAAPKLQQLMASQQQKINQVRQEAQRKGVSLVAGGGGGEGQLTDILVNVDEKILAEQIERLEETLGTLDGLFSLKNATTTISV